MSVSWPEAGPTVSSRSRCPFPGSSLRPTCLLRTRIAGNGQPAAEFKIFKNGVLTDAAVDVLLRGTKVAPAVSPSPLVTEAGDFLLAENGDLLLAA